MAASNIHRAEAQTAAAAAPVVVVDYYRAIQNIAAGNWATSTTAQRNAIK
jgi:hypothetical protein